MTQFHHVRSITSKNRLSVLEDNLKSFLDWSFLNIGGFVNVSVPTSGLYGGTSGFHNFKLSSDPTIQGNKLWEAPRKDWVYESGVSYNSSSPSIFSGLYLNNTFLPSPTGSGNYGYSINYKLGQVQFNNSVSPTSNVNGSYSYRLVQVYKSSDSLWWKEVQKETYNTANFKANGDYSITAVHRVQLPAIMIELAGNSILKPYQLGTTDNILTIDVFLHIFAPNASQRNSLTDILLAQKDKVLYLYDCDKAAKNQKYALNQYGSINPSGYSYNQLVDNFKYTWCTIKDSSLSEINTLSTNLYNSLVRWSVEILP
jgi:hypothetical protein